MVNAKRAGNRRFVLCGLNVVVIDIPGRFDTVKAHN